MDIDRNTLDKLKINEKGTVVSVEKDGTLKRRLLDLGIIKGSRIECVGKSPLGDPSAYLIKGAVVAIRARDARSVTIAREPEV